MTKNELTLSQPLANPVLIQSSFGNLGNFELVVPANDGGLAFYWRDNDDENLPWNGPIFFAQELGQVDAVTMIQSNFGHVGNLELVARIGNQLAFFWRDAEAESQWYGPFVVGSVEVPGNPVLIQSSFGNQGNFELVVPANNGGLAFYWRDNDDENLPWNGPIFFAQELGQVDAVTMIQSNFGHVGNLELVARIGNQLAFFWRDAEAESQWYGPFVVGSVEVSGNPVLIQSSFGNQGNFELVVPANDGGLAFYWRDNDDENLPWNGPIFFAQEVGQVDAVTMIQSNFGHVGNLELVARIGNQLAFFWRDAEAESQWHGPFFFAE
ncbi:MAG: hypothetical protein HEQ35_24570 [Gloeotrichia echinulata IR180]|jgi:hypothetical protein|nr:hypothetical protein [Gloeotrichia echinulata DEX184]